MGEEVCRTHYQTSCETRSLLSYIDGATITYSDDDHTDDYDDEDEKLTIFDDAKLELDNMDVHSLDKKLKLEPDPILNDVEILG